MSIHIEILGASARWPESIVDNSGTNLEYSLSGSFDLISGMGAVSNFTSVLVKNPIRQQWKPRNLQWHWQPRDAFAAEKGLAKSKGL